MSFLKRLFSSDDLSHKKNFDWISVVDLQQLEDIVTHSYEKIVLIFKHSTRCSISRFALQDFKREFNYSKEKIECYYLDLISFRDISNEIARKFEVEHQSPQIIILKNGKAIYSASHESINTGILERFI